jgi:Kef-type K+ transport system membrane component KefB
MAITEGSVFSGIAPTGDALSVFIVQLLFVLLITRILVLAFRPLKQPAVIAEVIAGILLGPSALSSIPEFKRAIFPDSSLPNLQLFANVRG